MGHREHGPWGKRVGWTGWGGLVALGGLGREGQGLGSRPTHGSPFDSGLGQTCCVLFSQHARGTTGQHGIDLDAARRRWWPTGPAAMALSAYRVRLLLHDAVGGTSAKMHRAWLAWPARPFDPLGWPGRLGSYVATVVFSDLCCLCRCCQHSFFYVFACRQRIQATTRRGRPALPCYSYARADSLLCEEESCACPAAPAWINGSRSGPACLPCPARLGGLGTLGALGISGWGDWWVPHGAGQAAAHRVCPSGHGHTQRSMETMGTLRSRHYLLWMCREKRTARSLHEVAMLLSRASLSRHGTGRPDRPRPVSNAMLSTEHAIFHH